MHPSVINSVRDDIMKSALRILSMTALVSATALSIQAQAYEAGDWVVRLGATQVAPAEDSSLLALDGAALTSPLNGRVGLDNDTQLGLTVEYMINQNWGIELLAATPFSHTASVTDGEALQGLNVADVKHLPPTLSAVYHFNMDSKFQPYVGVGINYTVFFDEDLTSRADATFASVGLTGGDIELDSSWGVALQIGADYHLNDRWLLNASVRWVDIETTAKIKFDNGSVIKSDIDVDPYVYTLSVGYKF